MKKHQQLLDIYPFLMIKLSVYYKSIIYPNFGTNAYHVHKQFTSLGRKLPKSRYRELFHIKAFCDEV